MASTFTTSLKFNKPALGDAGWGTAVNGGFTDLADSAIAGTTSVDVTLANVTLTSLNGAADQARQMFLVATGTPGVAREVIVPATSKLYFAKNESDDVVTFKVSGQTGVAVPVNASMALRVDTLLIGGADIVVAQDQFVDLTASGDVTVTGTTTLAALTASGNVSFDGGTFVFNESGADKDARFGGVTDANLLFLDASTDRVGVGTSNPAQKFVISNGGAAGLEIGPTAVNSAPALVSYDRSGAAWTQLTYAALAHVWQGSGAETMRLHASGNLGVNSAPSAFAKFYSLSDNDQHGVYGQTQGSGGSYYGVVGVTSKTASVSSGGVIGTSANGTTYGILGYYDTSAHWGGYFNGSVYVSDYVGIGTSSPSSLAKLAVSGFVSYNPGVSFAGAGGDVSWTTGFGPQALSVSIYGSNGLVGNSIYAVSDARLKKDVVTLPSGAGLEFVKAVDPVSFSWKADDRADTGFIAQSLMSKGYGHLVSAVPDGAMEEVTHEDGNVSPAGARFVVRYDSIVPILAAAIRDQQTLIDALTDRVAALEAK